jgi:hypothetical protein
MSTFKKNEIEFTILKPHILFSSAVENFNCNFEESIIAVVLHSMKQYLRKPQPFLKYYPTAPVNDGTPALSAKSIAF